MLDDLMSKEALDRDAHLSLRGRAARFNLNHEGFHMTYYRIRKLFGSYHLRKRVPERTLALPDHTIAERKRLQKTKYPEFLDLVEQGKHIVFIDEAVFTSG